MILPFDYNVDDSLLDKHYFKERKYKSQNFQIYFFKPKKKITNYFLAAIYISSKETMMMI